LVGKPPTPFLIFTQPYGDGRLFVVNSHLGLLEDTDKLFSMVKSAYKKSPPKSVAKLKKKQDAKVQEELVMPIPENEVMQKVRESMAVKGDKPGKLKKVKLEELGDVYTAVLNGSKRRIFARVVARRIPCIDCHDIFYIYSFDNAGKFMQFIPISISKLDNEEWDEKDISKMQKKFKGRSLLKERRFNSKVDAITSATISSKLIFDGISQTGLVINKLTDLGYMKKNKN